MAAPGPVTAPTGAGTPASGSVGVGDTPEFALYDSADGDVYVANSGSDNVSVLNGTAVVGTVAVGMMPDWAAFDPANGYVYVTNFGDGSTSSTVSVIEGTTLVATVPVGTAPQFDAYDAANGDVYVSNSGSGDMSIISGTTVVASFGVGSFPYAIAYDADNGFVYVTNDASNNVSVVNGTTVVTSVSVGVPDFAAYDAGNGCVYVANYNSASVDVINGTTVVGTVPVGSRPGSVAYDPGNGYVYVTNANSGSVSVIDGTTLVQTVTVGSDPGSTLYDPGNGYVYVSDEVSEDVTVLAGTLPVERVDVGTNPSWAAYDPSDGLVYVPNQGTDYVSLISGNLDLGWIAGTVTPSNAVVMVNGSVTPVTQGEFNQSVPYGSYPVRASLFGFSTFQTTVLVVPGATGTLPIVLTDHGWIVGSVRPASAAVYVDGQPAAVTSGRFNVSVVGSDLAHHVASMSYNVSAEASGYLTLTSKVTVTPGNLTTVSFTLQASSQGSYLVAFTETGLPSGTDWGVTVSGTPLSSTQATISVDEANGSYPFAIVPAVPGFVAIPASGIVTVSGAAVAQPISFVGAVAPTYGVTFEAAGLPSGTTWSVTFNGVTTSGTGDITFLGIANGTYGYRVGPVAGYTATPSSGSIPVAGHYVSWPIQFARALAPGGNGSGSGTLLGLPTTSALVLFAAIAGVVVVAAVVLLRRRGAAPPPEEAFEPPA